MIVGIGHVARVGKDVAAQALCRDLGFRRISFADPLKALALEADPMILAHQMTNVGIGSGHLKRLVHSMGWDQVKDQFPEARKFLQNLGVGARKVFGEDFWVQQAFAGIKSTDNVVFSDVRFENEADFIRYPYDGKLVRINRPGKVATGHVSETALIDFPFDAEIENNGSIVELEQKIVELARGWLANERKASDAASQQPVERDGTGGDSPMVEASGAERVEH